MKTNFSACFRRFHRGKSFTSSEIDLIESLERQRHRTSSPGEPPQKYLPKRVSHTRAPQAESRGKRKATAQIAKRTSHKSEPQSVGHAVIKDAHKSRRPMERRRPASEWQPSLRSIRLSAHRLRRKPQGHACPNPPVSTKSRGPGTPRLFLYIVVRTQ